MYDPSRHYRQSIRLPNYDYADAGAYFVTLCTKDYACLFGDVIDGTMQRNALGEVVATAWCWLSDRYPQVTLDAWILMPNHLHGLIALSATSQPKPLGRLIGAFKTVSTKRGNTLCGTPGARLWHRNYWERVIRSERERQHICRYIRLNPQRWSKIYPDGSG